MRKSLAKNAALTARKIRRIYRSWEEFGCGYKDDDCEQFLLTDMTVELAKACGVSYRRAKNAVLQYL